MTYEALRRKYWNQKNELRRLNASYRAMRACLENVAVWRQREIDRLNETLKMERVVKGNPHVEGFLLGMVTTVIGLGVGAIIWWTLLSL